MDACAGIDQRDSCWRQRPRRRQSADFYLSSYVRLITPRAGPGARKSGDRRPKPARGRRTEFFRHSFLRGFRCTRIWLHFLCSLLLCAPSTPRELGNGEFCLPHRTVSHPAAAPEPLRYCHGGSTASLRCIHGVSPMLMRSTWEIHRSSTVATPGPHRCSCLGPRAVRSVYTCTHRPTSQVMTKKVTFGVDRLKQL